MLVWRYLDAAGAEVGRSEEFPDRASAEAWLRESWEELLDGGVDEVALCDEVDRTDRYRMSLTPDVE